MTSKIITISIGQCGLQISHAVWELFCAEHGIQPDGSPFISSTSCSGENGDNNAPCFDDHEGFGTFFSESQCGKYVARAINCDLEATVMNEIRTGFYRNLFHPDMLLNCEEDGSSNYARGFFTIGKGMTKKVMDQVKRCVNNCDFFNGIVLINGYGGGTGSGLGDSILAELRTYYPKATIAQFSLMPGSKYSSSIIEPYNAMFATKGSMTNGDLCIQMSNDAAYGICNEKLGIQNPTFSHVNRMVAQIYSSVTASLRFNNPLYSDLTQIQTNIVPFPRIHFPTSSFSPFDCQSYLDHDEVSMSYITRELFEQENNLINCNVHEGKFMAVSLQYRGNCCPYLVNQAVKSIKYNRSMYKFVRWCPTGFKVGICNQPNIQVPGSGIGQTDKAAACLFNHTNSVVSLDSFYKKSVSMFNMRAFVHWYVGEGMEEGEFQEAREAVDDLIKTYKDCEAEPEGEEEDEEETSRCNNKKQPAKNEKPAPVAEPAAAEEDEEEQKESPEANGPSAAQVAYGGGGMDDETENHDEIPDEDGEEEERGGGERQINTYGEGEGEDGEVPETEGTQSVGGSQSGTHHDGGEDDQERGEIPAITEEEEEEEAEV